MQIVRSIEVPIRDYEGMDRRWNQEDKGLIWCWERGRQMAQADPGLAQRAVDGELMILGWRGGVEKPHKKPKSDGTLNYLAQWQGLRGDNLNVDTAAEFIMTCSKTETEVHYSQGSATCTQD